jgi:hypothetical protein
MVNNKQDPTIEELKLVLFTVMSQLKAFNLPNDLSKAIEQLGELIELIQMAKVFLGKMQQYQEKYSG